MTYRKLSFVSRITLLVLCVEVAAFTALGYFYVEQYSRAEVERLHSRFSLVQDMMQNGELPVSAISRQPFLTQLLDTPYLGGMVIGANGRVIVSTELRQLGKHASKLDNFDVNWLRLSDSSNHIISKTDRHTEILRIRGGSSEVPLYTVVLTASTRGIQQRRDNLIQKSLLGSLLFILLSSGGIVFIARRFYRSEQKTRAVKQQLEQVLWSSGDGWWDWNVKTGEAYFDQRWLGMLGYTQDEVEPDFHGWESLLHPDDVETVQKQLNSHLKGAAKDYEVRFRMRCKNSEWKWILARGKIVERDDSGRPLRMAGTHSDISERKRFEESLEESLEVYQAAINTPSLGFCSVDNQGRIVEVNDTYIRQSGFSREELVSMSVSDLEARDSQDEIKSRIDKIVTAGHVQFRTEHRRKDGSLWPTEVFITYSAVQGGRFFAFFEDLTDVIEQERRLELASRVFDTMNQAVVVTDASNKIVSLNPAATEITGYTLTEVRGKNPSVFASGRHGSVFYAEMWDSLKRTGFWEGEVWDRRKNGEVYPKWLTINAIYNTNNELDQYVSVFSDITERKKTEELIWKQANFDALTGLANRIQFQDHLVNELERHHREGSRLAVVYLDLDGFKDVNDSLGHAAGDTLLVDVASRLGQRVRKSDMVARLGGDEFVVLVTDFEEPELVGSLAEDVLEALQEPVKIKETEVHIGASIGISIYPDDGVSSEELIKNADIAMYQAKDSGKNNFQFFLPEMNAKAQHRLSLIRDLHRAVENGDFELYYQPKVRLPDQRIIGMEALIRWPLEEGVMVSPVDFIPCAEETGLIIPIGNWVLEEACRQTREWNRKFGARLQVAVNLSSRQFRSEGFLDDVMNTVNATGMSGDLLELEITESILMEDVEEAIRVMHGIREKGISIAIDDFGTGYSSLNYLKRFPITTLKIDKSFVGDLVEESDDAAIVGSTIILARSLKLDVVAEGVETSEQLEFLTAQQCHSAQGYYISKPMPADEFEQYLNTNSDKLIS